MGTAALVKAGAEALCPISGAVLRLADSTVTLECADAVALFDRAEEIADGKVNPSLVWHSSHYLPTGKNPASHSLHHYAAPSSSISSFQT